MVVAFAEPATQNAIRVLIVEDDYDSAEALESILTHAQCVVRVAHNGGQACAIALDFQPNIAVVDIGLPDVSGYEVAASLREIVVNCRLLASTAYCGAEYVRASFAAGFEAHLSKPMDLSRLLLLLEGNEAPLTVP